MNTLRLIATSALLSCLLYSCSTSRNSTAEGKRKRTKITTVYPGIKNPSRSVINATGDGLTPGIHPTNGAGSMVNATNAASNAIGRANELAKGKQLSLETLTDAELINRISTAQQMEISTSNSMHRTTKNDKIRDYTNMVSTDHMEIQKELKKLASEKNIKIDKEVFLAGSPKTDLDFIKMMIESNRNLITLYTIVSNSDEPGLRAFALKQLPILKKHMDTALKTRGELDKKAN
ncbi:DUF4142 domain-containing protein [Pedobacter gandavensis]|uniref:DUF4142 domain-containing protein n=1 Tax=Pedobacter gandavensis TaxID=2679963 RepID=UPI00292EFAA9|nr:DUF4142 domain-containing protein [Pedobacter gandavensis]